MSKIAVIPARGGSKRIPGKNIKDFLGKPVIAYSIEAALNSGLFDEVMVSTDDEEIAAIALKYGASVPFMRSAKTSDDFATTVEVILEVLETYRQNGIVYETGCCIYPTAPLIKMEALHQGLNLLEEGKYHTTFPVVAFSYSIWRSLKITDSSKAEMFWPENENKRSQDLEMAYHDAGQFYWFSIPELLKARNLFGARSGVIILKETEVQDIDSIDDWNIAELKYRMQHEA